MDRTATMMSEMIPELEVVRLLRDLDTPDGIVPAGTRGVVLLVFDGAYLVEFNDHDCPETVRAEDVERLTYLWG
jgi:hypothetical protein